jgi:hypothetical protein
MVCLMYLWLYAYIYAAVGIYMCIPNFEMQGINEKQKKMQQGLCRVYAHGKGHLVTLSCAYTRQSGNVALACAPWWRVVCLARALPCGWMGDAQQRLGHCRAGGGSAHDKDCSTAEARCMAMIGCTAEGIAARQ